MRIERAIVLSNHTDDHPSSNNNFKCLSAVPDHLVLEERSTERSIKGLIGHLLASCHLGLCQTVWSRTALVKSLQSAEKFISVC